jgi:hypothetical protein
MFEHDHPLESLLDKFNKHVIPNDKIKLNKLYWICDIEAAVGNTQDNVHNYDFTYKDKIIIHPDYIIFKSKKQALLFSKALYAEENK